MRRQNILILYYELVVNFLSLASWQSLSSSLSFDIKLNDICIFLDSDTMEKTKNPFPKSEVLQFQKTNKVASFSKKKKPIWQFVSSKLSKKQKLLPSLPKSCRKSTNSSMSSMFIFGMTKLSLFCHLWKEKQERFFQKIFLFPSNWCPNILSQKSFPKMHGWDWTMVKSITWK